MGLCQGEGGESPAPAWVRGRWFPSWGVPFCLCPSGPPARTKLPLFGPHSCGLAAAEAGSSLPLPGSAFPRAAPSSRGLGCPLPFHLLSARRVADFSSGSRGQSQPPQALGILSTVPTGLWEVVPGGAGVGGTALPIRDPHFLLLELGPSWAWACTVALSACYSVTAETVAGGGQVALGSGCRT